MCKAAEADHNRILESLGNYDKMNHLSQLNMSITETQILTGCQMMCYIEVQYSSNVVT